MAHFPGNFHIENANRDDPVPWAADVRTKFQRLSTCVASLVKAKLSKIIIGKRFPCTVF